MSKKKPVTTTTLRGDSHPTHGPLINMLEHAIQCIETNRLNEARAIVRGVHNSPFAWTSVEPAIDTDVEVAS